MEPAYVWVIIAGNGNYDDYSTWVESVWTSLKLAEEELSRLNLVMSDLYRLKSTKKDDPYGSRYETYEIWPNQLNTPKED